MAIVTNPSPGTQIVADGIATNPLQIWIDDLTLQFNALNAKAYAGLIAGGANTFAGATQGWWWENLVPLRVHGMIATVTEVIGATYVARIFSLSGSTIVAEIATSQVETGTISGGNTRSYVFTTTPTLVVGTDYAFLFSRTDLLDTTFPGNVNVAINPAPIPMNGPYGFARIVNKNPAPSDVLESKDLTFKPYPFPMIYELI